MKPVVSLILPTYNERENILPLIEKLSSVLDGHSVAWEMIVVDDDSPDGTGPAARERFAGDSRVRVVIRTGQRGLATAIRRGIDESGGSLVVVMDTDFNHEPSMLLQLIDFTRYYDMIVGSRFILSGGMRDWVRYYLSFAYNFFFIRPLLRTHVQDNLSGFFSIRREKLRELPADRIFWGYGDYFIRLLYYAARRKFAVLEVPVYYELRPAGESKTSFVRILLLYTRAVLELTLRRLAGRD